MSYKAFETGGTYGESLPMFIIWKKTGDAIARAYFSLLTLDYDPSGDIELLFASKEKISLRGKNLKGLFLALTHHEVSSIYEANRADVVGDTVVEKVVVS